MQWLLQDFEDTRQLGEALTRRGILHSWHKVVPFLGDLEPEPAIEDADNVILFGAYTMRRYAEARELRPGVFIIRPFAHEPAWRPYLLNGPNARFLTLRDVPGQLSADDRAWFVRPVSDAKELPGQVMSGAEIVALSERVCALEPGELPEGSLRHDTRLMLGPPARILREWRLWIVEHRVVTHSLYKDGRRVTYRPDIDADARAFAERLIALNPRYAPACVLDICRTEAGLRRLETNCLNAAGFYAADLDRLVGAIEGMARPRASPISPAP
ncbi:MAG: ATP-grasp domain-containing protein [Pseudomonadota bacterium]